MMLMTFRCRPTRQRPLRSWPLITDTTQLRPALAGLHRHPRLQPLGVAGHDDVRRQLVELALGSSLVDEIEPLVEFVHGEPPLARRVPEQVGGAFTVGVGGAELGKRVVSHALQPTVSGVRNAVHSLEPDLARAERDRAERDLILRTTVGSVVHGLSNPGTDDRDEMGVCIEPPEYLLGFRRFEHFVYRTQPEGHPSGPGDLDLTVYGLRKFCVLALKGSPDGAAAAVRHRRAPAGDARPRARSCARWRRRSSRARRAARSSAT